jgi:hypothetical protein
MPSTITGPVLDTFFDGLQVRLETAKTVRQELDRYLASGFNLFDVLWPDENQISSVLARLLDPNGGHGQGAMFLESFSNMLNTLNADSAVMPTDLDWVEAVVDTEHATSASRRIDVVVRFGKTFALGIENKPWAADQPAQLQDYHHHLKSQFDRHALVYLSGYGGVPSEGSISSTLRQTLELGGQFVSVPYNPMLRGWLEQMASKSESEKVRWYLRDFASWIDQQFPNVETLVAS